MIKQSIGRTKHVLYLETQIFSYKAILGLNRLLSLTHLETAEKNRYLTFSPSRMSS